VPHQQAGYMAAPTSSANDKKTLAKPEPSIHDPKRTLGLRVCNQAIQNVVLKGLMLD